jgi:hypothetical protein
MAVENSALPVRGVVPIDEMVGEDEQDTGVLRALASDAETFIQNHSWCKAIREFYYGNGYRGIVAIFLFRIEPTRPEVDEWLWVVVGDLPPAYIVIDDRETPSKALEGYIAEVSKWVELAKYGRWSKRFIHVNKPATRENADAVERRLNFLSEVLVPIFQSGEEAQSR